MLFFAFFQKAKNNIARFGGEAAKTTPFYRTRFTPFTTDRSPPR